MNCYATLERLKSDLGITATDGDARLLAILSASSRAIDGPGVCNRKFYSESATKYYDGPERQRLLIDDCLTLTALVADSERDQTFDGESWTEGEDYVLYPPNSYPKLAVETLPNGSYRFYHGQYRYKLTGTWGFGNGTSDPWSATAITGTVATATGATMTMSAEGTVEAGHTIKFGTEQMFVSSVTSNEATVTRGVNGTTAAAHDGAIVSIAQYPDVITEATLYVAAQTYNTAGRGAFASESIGDYSYTLSSQRGMRGDLAFLRDITAGYRREVIA